MKITFLGAGSTVFAKNVLGDCIINPILNTFDIALYDIDEQRLDESYVMLNNINATMQGKAIITKYTDRKTALIKSDYVINAIQVGGYKPSTVIDFEIPKKYGLNQTIGDTLGIGGIFRALRTIPVLEDFAKDMEEVCPNALFINYVNPMAILTGYMQRYTNIKTIGLCHSVQICVPRLLKMFDMTDYLDSCSWSIAGINHMSWLLSIKDANHQDLYPEIKRRLNDPETKYNIDHDLVRLELMKKFGYYVTESSEHNAEYLPYFIKKNHPELIEQFNIPIDEYPRRCENQIAAWGDIKKTLLSESLLVHEKSYEYVSDIITACETDQPYRVHGNVLNTNLITNLPLNACVEVPIMIDRNGINPIHVGTLPEQLAALNRSNINVQLLTIEAARSRLKEKIYQAAYLDPHTSSELTLEEIQSLCDDMIAAHGKLLPTYL